MVRGAELNCFHLGKKLLHPDPLPFPIRSSGEVLDELISWNVHYVLLSYLHLPPVSSIWCLCPVGLASLINKRTFTSIPESHSNSKPQTQDSGHTFLKTNERYRYATSHSSGDNVPAFNEARMKISTRHIQKTPFHRANKLQPKLTLILVAITQGTKSSH